MTESFESDAGPPREQDGVAEAEAALESEHERHLKAARDRTNAIADRLARAAGYPGMLRPGKIVRLKSGSPPMTIACVDIVDGLVYCHYFWRGGPGQARYSAEMLEPCDPARPESFVPPKKPGVGDPWDQEAPAHAARENPRRNPGRGDKRTRARRNKTRKSKANPEREVRAEGEPASDAPLLDRRERNKAWRETLRRIARLKRRVAEREKLRRAAEEGASADLGDGRHSPGAGDEAAPVAEAAAPHSPGAVSHPGTSGGRAEIGDGDPEAADPVSGGIRG